MATLSAIHNNEPTPNASKETHMKAARMHEYGKPPILEDIPVPDIHPDEILVNVKACGMCRSDVQLIDGYFRKYVDIPTPITIGHEITGVSKIGSIVPKGDGAIGLQPAVDQRSLCRRGSSRRSHRYTAIPARGPRT